MVLVQTSLVEFSLDRVILFTSKNSHKYLTNILSNYNLTTCKSATTTGMSTYSSNLQQCDEPLDSAEHTQYRSTVGKLMWLIAIRYDIFYAVKELSRNLTAPTQYDLAKLKHLLRYLRGTLSLVTVLRPQIQFTVGNVLDIQAFTDSDWAGCQKTRKSTFGTVVQILGCTVIALSRTQQTLALSSGEAELYAIGTSILESLHIRSFMLEIGLSKKCNITIHTLIPQLQSPWLHALGLRGRLVILT